MGLFASKSRQSLSAGKLILGPSLDEFNRFVGAKYQIKVSVNGRALRECCDQFERFSAIGFPEVPGPFKRMARFAVLSQHYELFKFEIREKRGVPKKQITNEALLWGPRLALWALPSVADAISVNGDRELLTAFDLPTRHFQVEFLGILRNYAYGQKMSGVVPDEYLLLERCASVALILEACAYSALTSKAKNRLIAKGAQQCSEAMMEDPELLDDVIFNDKETVRTHIISPVFDFDQGGSPLTCWI